MLEIVGKHVPRMGRKYRADTETETEIENRFREQLGRL